MSYNQTNKNLHQLLYEENNENEDQQNEGNEDSSFGSTATQRTTQESRLNVKLPNLEIHRFKGDHTKWQNFIDAFEASIDSSPILSNIEKHINIIVQINIQIIGMSATLGNVEELRKFLKAEF